MSKRFCSALELIAFAIHSGDTQSTTTVCWESGGKILFITSQTNASYEDVTLQKVGEILDYLTLSAALYQERKVEKADCKADYWERYCALCEKELKANKTALEKINKLFNNVYDRIWKRFLEQNYRVDELQKLKSDIWHVIVVLDNMIFSGKAPEKTGFHGESRILRWLFIRDYPGVHLQQTQTFFYQEPGQKLSANTKQNAYDWFKAHLKNVPLAMGSSQGTCKKCATCLDDYQVAHETPENEPQQWLDPLTMCGNQGSTPIVKSDSHHAIYPAFHYLVRPDDT